MELVRMKVRFEGLYDWDIGWRPGKKEKWDAYWHGVEKNKNLYDRIFWNVGRENSITSFGTWYLFGTGGSVYLFPGLNNIMFESSNEAKYGYEGQVRELLRLFEGSARYCGGEVNLESLKLKYLSLESFNEVRLRPI